MTKRIFSLLAVLGLIGVSLVGQSKPSIQGVWRIVERTTTGPNAATNKDPQPSLFFFTGKHYSFMQIVSDKPRPVMPFIGQNVKLQDGDMIAAYREWEPFIANAGTFELKGSTLMIRPIVSKTSAVMANKDGQAYEFKIDGNTLWLTSTIGVAGKVTNPTTTRLMRVE